MKNQSKINGIIRTIILSFGIIALSFNVGCKKKTDDVVTPVAQTCKISKGIINNDITSTITYNSDFKMSSVTVTQPGQPTAIDTYSYPTSNKIRVDNNYIANSYNEYELNSAGNIIKKTTYLQGTTSIRLYEYNTEGYLSKMTRNSDVTDYIYENGNLKRTIVHYPNTTEVTTTEYEYIGLQTANPMIDLTNEESNLPFGKQNKNLVKKETITTSTSTFITTYDYTINSSNQITKISIQSDINGSTLYDLSYTCR